MAEKKMYCLNQKCAADSYADSAMNFCPQCGEVLVEMAVRPSKVCSSCDREYENCALEYCRICGFHLKVKPEPTIDDLEYTPTAAELLERRVVTLEKVLSEHRKAAHPTRDEFEKLERHHLDLNDSMANHVNTRHDKDTGLGVSQSRTLELIKSELQPAIDELRGLTCADAMDDERVRELVKPRLQEVTDEVLVLKDDLKIFKKEWRKDRQAYLARMSCAEKGVQANLRELGTLKCQSVDDRDSITEVNDRLTGHLAAVAVDSGIQADRFRFVSDARDLKEDKAEQESGVVAVPGYLKEEIVERANMYNRLKAFIQAESHSGRAVAAKWVRLRKCLDDLEANKMLF